MAKLSPAAVVCIGLLVVMALGTQVTSASCPNALYYSSCLNAARGTAPPSSTCCNAIRTVGMTNGGPACLCAMAKSGTFGISFSAARSLVSKCGLPNPTGYVCK